jgi:lysyl-tRNA synthetase class 1
MRESYFWADQKAREILEKESFHYLDRPVPERESYIVKTSASLSGVLHIGRLSDTIRADSIVTSLKDAGAKASLIWVAEDADPFRKVPEGVPKEYEKYLGMPVTDVEDPSGCHDSYAEHHTAEYMEVIGDFISNDAKYFSTREEYRKGSFRPFIQKILERREEVREILGRYRDSELSPTWSPWKPICAECGKVITPRLLEADGTWVKYECRDYEFEKTIARGCGHLGEADATRDDGKLLWKSEWASEWALWEVSCEGGGKEYEVPTSAWWVNGEIVEHILDYPMPTPFFYEMLLIDGKKMSASLGNVVFPSEWLRVAPPELLRFLYNKKLMKTRSFSWDELPRLYSDYDNHAAVFYGETAVPNEKERSHMTRLYEISQLEPPPEPRPRDIDFSFASLIAQIYDPKTRMAEAIQALRRSEVIGEDLVEGDIRLIEERLNHGINWIKMFVPERALSLKREPDPGVLASLTREEKKTLLYLARSIRENPDPDSIQTSIFSLSKSNGVKPGRMFQILYRLIIGLKSGPRLGPLVAALGSEEIADLIESAGT